VGTPNDERQAQANQIWKAGKRERSGSDSRVAEFQTKKSDLNMGSWKAGTIGFGFLIS
jgi:hypothetical protein